MALKVCHKTQSLPSPTNPLLISLPTIGLGRLHFTDDTGQETFSVLFVPDTKYQNFNVFIFIHRPFISNPYIYRCFNLQQQFLYRFDFITRSTAFSSCHRQSSLNSRDKSPRTMLKRSGLRVLSEIETAVVVSLA